ncbi:MAG: hypothetical protein EZS28_011396 [Streblomastix strix]|uniref:Reverse transcriptase domain-containing protein n=1 Tax=Streblomastix strix TaxID=222440 RepID=A0A5J4WDR7_9EUKA|nr:MAG: hypothetical protein EZS28_011396 [Streblomastix strix]
MLIQGDWIMKIDQEQAFHHIIVDKDFRLYLGFTHQNRYCQYRAMRFGVKQAPLTFNKSLRPVIRIIREELGVRILAYCDDIIIIHEDRRKLLEAMGRILNLLMNFGWKIAMNKSILESTKEIFWVKFQIDKNKPIQTTIAQSEAILATEASLPKKIEPLNIETDNSSSAFNINKGAAAVALAKQVDRTLETAENCNIQLHTYFIPGTQNKILDSLSRLATSGDYVINQQILNEALHILKVKHSIDLFSNRKNRRFKRFVNMIRESWAVVHDSLSISWRGEVPQIHPPIPLIQAVLNKLEKEKITALMVDPNWISQSWWSNFMKSTSKLLIEARSEDVLIQGGWMNKQRKSLPPGEMTESLLEEIKVKNTSDGHLSSANQQQQQQIKQQKDGTSFEADTDKDQANSKKTV